MESLCRISVPGAITEYRSTSVQLIYMCWSSLLQIWSIENSCWTAMLLPQVSWVIGFGFYRNNGLKWGSTCRIWMCIWIVLSNQTSLIFAIQKTLSTKVWFTANSSAWRREGPFILRKRHENRHLGISIVFLVLHLKRYNNPKIILVWLQRPGIHSEESLHLKLFLFILVFCRLLPWQEQILKET